jgi:hypothetical protein
MIRYLRDNSKSIREYYFFNMLDDRRLDEQKDLEEMPMHLIWEWELIEAITSFSGVSLNPVFFTLQNVMFTTEDLKRHYYYLKSPQFWGERYDFRKYIHDNSEFDYKYGEDGLFDYLIGREGIEYDVKEDMWYISQEFFIDMLKYYHKTACRYGHDFMSNLTTF